MISHYTKPLASGRCVATVTLEIDEQLIVVKDNSYYQIGDQIVQGSIVANVHCVVWCHIKQKWIPK